MTICEPIAAFSFLQLASSKLASEHQLSLSLSPGPGRILGNVDKLTHS
jgi:hypothetical protein